MTENKLTTVIIIAILLVMLAGVGALYVASQEDEEADNQPANTEQVDQDQSKDSDNATKDDSESKQSDTDKDQQTEGVSRDEAGKIATDKYGGTIKSVEDDDYHDIPAWEVEIRDSKEGRIEVKVDKKTGEILDMEKD